MRFKTIEGRIIEKGIGCIFVEYNSEIAPTTVVFGEEKDKMIFGLHDIESLGLEMDPLA